MSFAFRLEPVLDQKFEQRPVWILLCPDCKQETAALFGATHVDAHGVRRLYYICRSGHGTTSPLRRRVDRRMPVVTQVPDCCVPAVGLPFDLT